MIRITVKNASYDHPAGHVEPAHTLIKEFADAERAIALDWLLRKGYFEEGYTTSATWEVVQ